MPDWEYFTADELTALPDMDDPKYSDERKAAAAAFAVAVIERETRTSFIPRPRTEVLDGSGAGGLLLSDPLVRSLTTVTVGGVTVDTAGLIVNGGVLHYVTGRGVWAAGVSNVVVTYMGGYSSTPPADIKEAALQLARAHLIETDSGAYSNPHAVELTNEIGGTSKLSDVDEDHPTGIPSVDRTIVAYRDRVAVYGFA